MFVHFSVLLNMSYLFYIMLFMKPKTYNIYLFVVVNEVSQVDEIVDVIILELDWGPQIEGLRDDWIPKCPMEKKTFVGQIFGSVDSAFKFYVDYDRISGFDCHRSTERKDKSRSTVAKYFFCSRA